MSQPSQIDPRGPQFTAALTAVVLALVLLTAPSPFGIALLAVQAALFAVGVGLGVQRGPWAVLFRRVVRPRLAPPAHLEDPAPPRFAQGVGLVFTLVALAGYLTVRRWSVPWPPGSPWPRRCSTRCSGSAWAASCTW